MLSVERLPFSWRLWWQKSTLTGHNKQNNREKGGKGTDCLQNLCVLCVFLRETNCLSRPINHAPATGLPSIECTGNFSLLIKGKQIFILLTFNIPQKVVSLRFLHRCLLLRLPISPRKAQHTVVLVVYYSESPIKLMLMRGDNTHFCCQYYYKGPIFQSVLP